MTGPEHGFVACDGCTDHSRPDCDKAGRCVFPEGRLKSTSAFTARHIGNVDAPEDGLPVCDCNDCDDCVDRRVGEIERETYAPEETFVDRVLDEVLRMSDGDDTSEALRELAPEMAHAILRWEGYVTASGRAGALQELSDVAMRIKAIGATDA